MIAILWRLAVSPLGVLVLAGAMSLSPLIQDLPPTFELYTTRGKSLVGALELLTVEGQIKLVGPSPRFQPDRWLTLRRHAANFPGHPVGPQVVFTSGDKVALAEKPALLIADGTVSFDPEDPLKIQGGRFHSPRSAVALIWLAPPPDAEATLLIRQLASLEPESDIVRLRHGDTMEGTITAANGKGCTMIVRKRELTVPLETIRAIVFRGALRVASSPQGRFTHVVLQNGSRLAVVAASVKAGSGLLTGRTAFEDALSIPLDGMLGLEVRGGAATYLSDIEPSKYVHVPFLGASWPLMRDGSVSNRELKLGESNWDKGLGMHAECRVVYPLAGNYRWFEARVGLDPVFGKRGRVKLRVLVDDKDRDIGDKELTAADGARDLRIDVRGGRELTLEVLCAGFGDVEAHVNWADARLVK